MCCLRDSAEAARDVILGSLILGIEEQFLGASVLDKITQKEECRPVRDAACLLHVVRHDDYRILLLEFVKQSLDLGCRYGVEGAGGFVHQHHIGLDGQNTCDAEPLLLATRKTQRGAVQPVLDFIKQRSLLEAALDDVVERRSVLYAMDTRTIGYVVVEAHRERIGFLENHAYAFPEVDHVGLGCEDVGALIQDGTFDTNAVYQVVHAVECPQKCRLPAARWSNQRGNASGLDVDGDLVQGLGLAIPEVQLPDRELGMRFLHQALPLCRRRAVHPADDPFGDEIEQEYYDDEYRRRRKCLVK